MNPLALIVLLGLGVAAFNTMADDYTGNRLSVKIISLDSVKLSTAGLKFNCSIMISNPLERSLTYNTSIINTTINSVKFSQTQSPGSELKKGDNMQALEWIIPYDKIIPIIQALALNKVSKADVSITLDVKAEGYTGSALKKFKVDDITKIKI